MIYSFWAFQSCTVFCDKRERKHLKMKARKDPEQNQNLREVDMRIGHFKNSLFFETKVS